MKSSIKRVNKNIVKVWTKTILNENGKEKYFSMLEIFYTLKEAKTLIEKWRMEYNTFRPHSSLNYRPPAPEAYLN